MEENIGWSDDIECENGPVLFANADDFVHWRGARAATKLRASAHQRAFEGLGNEGLQQFADGHACYLWCIEPGSIRVSVDASRAWLIMAQVEYADSEADRAAAHAFPLSYAETGHIAGLRYRVDAGPVVIACAEPSALDTSTSLDKLPLSAASPGALIDFASGSSAAALWLAPGEYEPSLFWHEEDRWGVSWCRLQRISD